jgi:hypothetical protein
MRSGSMPSLGPPDVDQADELMELEPSDVLKGRGNRPSLLTWRRPRQGFRAKINAVATVIIGGSMVAVLLPGRMLSRAGTA